MTKRCTQCLGDREPGQTSCPRCGFTSAQEDMIERMAMPKDDRVTELEKQNAELMLALQEARDSLQFIHDTFKRDMDQGYSTKDKQFAVSIASMTLQAVDQASQPIGQTAEDYLREKYGAYRGHHAWRELEAAFNAGKASNSQPVSGAELTEAQLVELAHSKCIGSNASTGTVQSEWQWTFGLEGLRSLLSASGTALTDKQIDQMVRDACFDSPVKDAAGHYILGVDDIRIILSASGQASQSEKAVRDAALEEAAKICDTHRHGSSNYAATCALQIRALASTPAQQTEAQRPEPCPHCHGKPQLNSPCNCIPF